MGQERAPAVPLRAKQGAEARDWSWVEASVWTDRMVSALVNGVKGGRWFSLIDKVYAPATLEAAWEKVRANRGAAGVDGQSIERFAAQAELYLTELATALREGTYRPQPIRRVESPKGDGRTRPLGIPTVKDRIAQTAMKFVLEPIFEAMFHSDELWLPAGAGLWRGTARSGWPGRGGIHLCDRRRLGKLLRHDPARTADAAGRGTRQ